LYDAGVHAAKEAAGLGAEQIRVGNRQVVAGDRQIEIVLERQINGIFQR
jgi:hypothetical protein